MFRHRSLLLETPDLPAEATANGPNTVRKDVVNSLQAAGISVDVLEGVECLNKATWYIVFTEARVRDMQIGKTISLHGQDYALKHPNPMARRKSTTIKVRIFGYPLDSEHFFLERALNIYGDLWTLEDIFDRDLDIKTGVKMATFRALNEQIPSYIRVGRHQIRVQYDGQPKTCRKCYSTDHFARDCQAGKVCKECGDASHERGNCPNVRCFACKGKGHKEQFCPEYLRQFPSLSGNDNDTPTDPQNENIDGTDTNNETGHTLFGGDTPYKKLRGWVANTNEGDDWSDPTIRKNTAEVQPQDNVSQETVNKTQDKENPAQGGSNTTDHCDNNKTQTATKTADDTTTQRLSGATGETKTIETPTVSTKTPDGTVDKQTNDIMSQTDNNIITLNDKDTTKTATDETNDMETVQTKYTRKNDDTTNKTIDENEERPTKRTKTSTVEPDSTPDDTGDKTDKTNNTDGEVPKTTETGEFPSDSDKQNARKDNTDDNATGQTDPDKTPTQSDTDDGQEEQPSDKPQTSGKRGPESGASPTDKVRRRKQTVKVSSSKNRNPFYKQQHSK